MFYPRPVLPQLLIDLREPVDSALTGRTASQFRVTTSEGRALNIQYKRGHLRVGYEPTADSADSLFIADAEIGPSSSTTICLEQVCDLLGITIGGKRVDLSETKRRALAEHALVIDWSGKTTYFECELYARPEEGAAFLDAVRQEFPDTHFLRPLWRDTFNRGVEEVLAVNEALENTIIAIGRKDISLEDMKQKKHVALFEMEDAFEHIVHFALRPDFLKSSEHNRPIAAYPEITFAEFIGGRMAARFSNDDMSDASFRGEWFRFMNRYFTKLLVNIDLKTGAIIDQMETPVWVSQELAEWCRQAPDRFIYATQENALGERGHFGRRPA